MTKPMIVAELGASHCSSFVKMLQLMDAAAAAGADAVKIQVYTPGGIAADVQIPSGPWAGRSYHDLYREGMTPAWWLDGLFEHAKEKGILLFASPFSPADVQLLETVGCPMYKIASPEIAHYQLITAAAATGKPIILSTGMATKAEIDSAVRCVEQKGVHDITVLHCISSYPAAPADFNLKTMLALKARYPKFGLSDHSLSPVAAIIAAANGADVIEKHFTISRRGGGPDATFSLEPREFAALVRDCRAAADAMGTTFFGVRPAEATSAQYRRSIWLVKDIGPGELITPEHLAVLRPNYGLHPSNWTRLIGMRAVCDLPANTPMKWGYVK